MNKLAILFPGVGYTADRPLLRFGKLLAQELGYEVLTVSYQVTLDKSLPNEVRMNRVCAEALEQARAALREIPLERYDAFLLLGKSIGTAVAAGIASSLPPEKEVKTVLLTPVEAAFSHPIRNAIAFTGTADPWVAPDTIPALCRARDIPCLVFDHADHSLETGDVYRSLDILRTCMETVEQFCRSE